MTLPFQSPSPNGESEINYPGPHQQPADECPVRSQQQACSASCCPLWGRCRQSPRRWLSERFVTAVTASAFAADSSEASSVRAGSAGCTVGQIPGQLRLRLPPPCCTELAGGQPAPEASTTTSWSLGFFTCCSQAGSADLSSPLLLGIPGFVRSCSDQQTAKQCDPRMLADGAPA